MAVDGTDVDAFAKRDRNPVSKHQVQPDVENERG